ncbi:MAG: thiol reductant ABC exporter subunit CydC [Gammaproteobacteria bacterium]
MDSIKILSRLLLLYRPCWGWMLLGVLLSLITIIANVGLLALAGWFIAMMGIAGAAGITHVNYFTPAACIRGFAIVRTAGRYAERLVTHEATFRILSSLRSWFYDHLEPLAPAVLQNYHSGDLLSRMRADIDHLENFYLRILLPFVVAVIATLLFCFFLNRYDTRLVFVEIALVLIAGFIIPLIISYYAKPSGMRIVKTKSEMRMTSIDSVQGLGEILIFGTEEFQQKKLSRLTDQLNKDQLSQRKFSAFSQAMIGLVANIAMLSVLFICIPLITDQTLQPAQLPMLALFMLATFEAILPLPFAFQLLPETLTAAKRIFSIVDSKPIIAEPVTASPSPEFLDIKFDHVDFFYDQTQVLRNLSFNFPVGKNLGIIGESGCGKTSIVNLLLRFRPYQQGQITLGNFPIEDFHGEDLRNYFSVVSQQSALFNSTIRANLLLANPGANQQKIEHVCKLAQIDKFISTLPEGYDTWVGEAGIRLSGGQARRIVIARALLKDSPILILDEPGEGLDVETETALLDAIINEYSDRSILLITHKKTGLEKMDQIIKL